MSGILIYGFALLAQNSLYIDCLVGKDLFRFGAAEGSTRVCVCFLVLFRRHRKTSKSARSILRAAKVLYWLMNMGSNIAPELFLGLLRKERKSTDIVQSFCAKSFCWSHVFYKRTGAEKYFTVCFQVKVLFRLNDSGGTR